MPQLDLKWFIRPRQETKMASQKLVLIPTSSIKAAGLSIELPLKEYIDGGWTIISYQVCPNDQKKFPDVVVLLEKRGTAHKAVGIEERVR